MKLRRIFLLIFVVVLLLSACGKAAPEAGSQPGTSSQPPASSSTGTTAPPPTTAPPTTAPPINQEVTPKASYVWNGKEWSDGAWEVVDQSDLPVTHVDLEFGQPIEAMQRVYYTGCLPAVLETYPDDRYILVRVYPAPTVYSKYPGPDTSEEYHAMFETLTVELTQRLREAGYPIFYEEDSWYWGFGKTTPTWVVTIMSVGEIKALNCGDDFSVLIDTFYSSGVNG